MDTEKEYKSATITSNIVTQIGSRLYKGSTNVLNPVLEFIVTLRSPLKTFIYYSRKNEEPN